MTTSPPVHDILEAKYIEVRDSSLDEPKKADAYGIIWVAALDVARDKCGSWPWYNEMTSEYQRIERENSVKSAMRRVNNIIAPKDAA